jgi:AcrR family transcriptional regulator
VTPAKTARERVLEVAGDLFYREGVRAVGIDTIIARSGVAKMSLYRNFASKDDLVVAYLEERDRRFFAWWDGAVGPEGEEPSARLRRLVRATVEKVRRPGYRGCPFLNTSAEFPDAAHPARAVIAAHRGEVRERLHAICRRWNPRRPEALATQLIVLMDGVYASAGALTDGQAAAIVEAADALIEARRAARGR